MDTNGPPSFMCPIGHEIMTDPVMDANGHSYEREKIEDWFRLGNKRSPHTNTSLPHTNLTPNWNLKQAIQNYQASSTCKEENATVQTPQLKKRKLDVQPDAGAISAPMATEEPRDEVGVKDVSVDISAPMATEEPRDEVGVKDVSVETWLSSLGPAYVSYRDELINWGFDSTAELEYLTEEDMTKMSVKVGHRRRMLQAAAILGSVSAQPSPAMSPSANNIQQAPAAAPTQAAQDFASEHKVVQLQVSAAPAQPWKPAASETSETNHREADLTEPEEQEEEQQQQQEQASQQQPRPPDPAQQALQQEPPQQEQLRRRRPQEAKQSDVKQQQEPDEEPQLQQSVSQEQQEEDDEQADEEDVDAVEVIEEIDWEEEDTEVDELVADKSEDAADKSEDAADKSAGDVSDHPAPEDGWLCSKCTVVCAWDQEHCTVCFLGRRPLGAVAKEAEAEKRQADPRKYVMCYDGYDQFMGVLAVASLASIKANIMGNMHAHPVERQKAHKWVLANLDRPYISDFESHAVITGQWTEDMGSSPDCGLCTLCAAPDGWTVRHPVLPDVRLCRPCRGQYSRQKFPLDADGSDRECRVCAGRYRQDILICEGCMRGYHARCLQISTPAAEDPWFCPLCPPFLAPPKPASLAPAPAPPKTERTKEMRAWVAQVRTGFWRSVQRKDHADFQKAFPGGFPCDDSSGDAQESAEEEEEVELSEDARENWWEDIVAEDRKQPDKVACSRGGEAVGTLSRTALRSALVADLQGRRSINLYSVHTKRTMLRWFLEHIDCPYGFTNKVAQDIARKAGLSTNRMKTRMDKWRRLWYALLDGPAESTRPRKSPKNRTDASESKTPCKRCSLELRCDRCIDGSSKQKDTDSWSASSMQSSDDDKLLSEWQSKRVSVQVALTRPASAPSHDVDMDDEQSPGGSLRGGVKEGQDALMPQHQSPLAASRVPTQSPPQTQPRPQRVSTPVLETPQPASTREQGKLQSSSQTQAQQQATGQVQQAPQSTQEMPAGTEAQLPQHREESQHPTQQQTPAKPSQQHQPPRQRIQPEQPGTQSAPKQPKELQLTAPHPVETRSQQSKQPHQRQQQSASQPSGPTKQNHVQPHQGEQAFAEAQPVTVPPQIVQPQPAPEQRRAAPRPEQKTAVQSQRQQQQQQPPYRPQRQTQQAPLAKPQPRVHQAWRQQGQRAPPHQWSAHYPSRSPYQHMHARPQQWPPPMPSPLQFPRPQDRTPRWGPHGREEPLRSGLASAGGSAGVRSGTNTGTSGYTARDKAFDPNDILRQLRRERQG